jgi:hypothetical protein
LRWFHKPWHTGTVTRSRVEYGKRRQFGSQLFNAFAVIGLPGTYHFASNVGPTFFGFGGFPKRVKIIGGNASKLANRAREPITYRAIGCDAFERFAKIIH